MNRRKILPVLFCLCAWPMLRAQAPPAAWISRGIGGGGALFSPEFSPHDPDACYMSCDMGELFRSTDLGRTWDTVHFRQVSAGSLSRVCFTSDPDILYVLQYLGWGYMPSKSKDGGKTWEILDSFPEDREAFTLFADKRNPDRLIVTTWSRLYYSGDGGASFHEKFSTSDDAGILAAGAFFNGKDITMASNLGLLVSEDGGASFGLHAPDGIPEGQGMISFDASTAGGAVKFWCTAGDRESLWGGMTGGDAWELCRGIYSLYPGAATWKNRTGGIDLARDFPYFISCADSDTAVAYTAGMNESGMPIVMKTTDGGSVWEHVFLTENNENISTGWQGHQGDVDYWWGGFAEGFAAADNDPDKLALTDLGFIHMSTDGGRTWQQKYVDPAYENPAGAPTPKGKTYRGVVNQTSVWHVHWNDPEHLFGCFTDIRGIRSTDGGDTWSFDYSGHDLNTMYRIIPGRAGNGIIYAATGSVHDLYMSHRLGDDPIDEGEGFVLASTDGGANWDPVHDFRRNVVWVEPDPDDAHRLYACVVHSESGGIYVTGDLQNGSSSSWVKLADPPRTEGHPKVLRVLNDGTLVAAYSGRIASGFTPSSGIFVSTDSGASWMDRSDPAMFYWTQDIVIDPSDPDQDTWYACVFSGWGGAPNGLGGLYRTGDRGASWSRISGLNRVYSCTFNPENPDQMFVTTEGDGLWFSGNIRDDHPVLEPVESYPFGFPAKVFFNPFDSDEVWVAGFGSGLMTGRMDAGTGIQASGEPANAGNFGLDAHPNPFNPDVQIRFDMPVRAHIRIEIVDMQGRLIDVPAQGHYDRGIHSVRWNAAAPASILPSGVYLCRCIMDGRFRRAVKLVLKK
ncbi:hypothetical protein JW906_11675 [bacterium]|nr:hypothetical protein [bacterium]